MPPQVRHKPGSSALSVDSAALLAALQARAAVLPADAILAERQVGHWRAEILSNWLTTGKIAAEAVGRVYETSLGWLLVRADARWQLQVDTTQRSRQGSFFTPPAVVACLLDATLEPAIAAAQQQPDPVAALLQITVLDPACGTGHFLLAAGLRMVGAIVQNHDIQGKQIDSRAAWLWVVRDCLYGIDLDADAVALCRLLLQAASQTDIAALSAHVVVGNALIGAPPTAVDPDLWCQQAALAGLPRKAPRPVVDRKHLFHWHRVFPQVAAAKGFAVVVGNPPYLNQLQSDSALDRSHAAILRARTHGTVAGLADASTAFFALANEWLQPGGRVALVVPHAFLVAHDAQPVRQLLADQMALVGLWYARERTFVDAQVFTCAPVLQKGAAQPQVLPRWHLPACTPTAPLALVGPNWAKEETWAPLVADLNGVPTLSLPHLPVLGTLASATADFRDQYYGLLGCIVDQRQADDALWPPLITSGLIDLADNLWGQLPARILKQAWTHPRVDAARLAATTKLGPWLTARRVPKVLLATQTPVLEVVVDEPGHCLPSVPVVTIVPRHLQHLWDVAAAIASPVACAWAAARYAGAGMTHGALKLSATQVLALPLPDLAHPQWAAATAALRAAHLAPGAAQRAVQLQAFGQAAVLAYGLSVGQALAVMGWWATKLRGTSPKIAKAC